MVVNNLNLIIRKGAVPIDTDIILVSNCGYLKIKLKY